MARESTQHKLDRVRPPRVQITYDVEIGDAIETKELPFMLGVLGDFSGMPAEPLPKLKKRKFVPIDRDNFNQVMKGMKPRLVYRVNNTLAKDGSQLPVELNFKHIEDFEPEQVVEQIKPLREILEKRRKLSDLCNKMYGNERLEELLQEVLLSTEQRDKLGKEVGYKTRTTDEAESSGEASS